MENKRLVLESVMVVLGLCIVFSLGFHTGKSRVEPGSMDTRGNLSGLVEDEAGAGAVSVQGDRKVGGDRYLGSRVVDSVSSYRVNGYGISFETEAGDRFLRENGWSGYTWGNGSIVVRSGSSVSWTYDVCRHEVKHNVYPELNHSEMEERGSVEARSTCLELLYLLDG
jgi:hypothetical protein